MELDKRIETVLDVLLHRANKCEAELEVEKTFDDTIRGKSSIIIRNATIDKFGIIAVDVENYEDEPIVFFTFNSKLYQYCKAEGFELKQMLYGFENKVFEKVSIKTFFEFILDDK
tara:strand:- start:59 stop:403 length:345 start_codon:yes stop_codon:yes gene_type:complete